MFVAGQGLSAGRGGPNPDLFRQQAEMRIAAGSDWVKIYGSRGSFQSVDTTQTVTFDEMKAAIDAAHAKGHRVAVHSYGASGVKDAVRAGADSVEHGIELDDETIAEMVARGTVWVPTIDHNRYYVDATDDGAVFAQCKRPGDRHFRILERVGHAKFALYCMSRREQHAIGLAAQHKMRNAIDR